MTYPRIYYSTTSGAPTLTGQAGSLVNLLDAVLVNGYASRTVATLTRTGAVATATVSAGHPYQVRDVIEISGANEPNFNGTFRVTSVSGNDFSFAIADSGATSATGTITAKIAGAGWSVPFSGSNRRAYQQPAAIAGKPIFRILDEAIDSNRRAQIFLYESMSDADTGLGGSAAGMRRFGGITKSQSADATQRPWIAIVGAEAIYFFHNPWGLPNNRYQPIAFGVFNSLIPGDPYRGFSLAGDNPNGVGFTAFANEDYFHTRKAGSLYVAGLDVTAESTANYSTLITRSSTGQLPGIPPARIAAPISARIEATTNTALYFFGAIVEVPDPISQDALVEDFWIVESMQHTFRGKLYGMHASPGNFLPPGSGAFNGPFTATADFSDGSLREVMVIPSTSNPGSLAGGAWIVDITGPWS